MVQHKAQDVTARPRTEDVHVSEDIDFKSMLLPEPILQGLKKAGYVKPSPIQKKALPLVRCGLDLIVQAKAGTGKTCVFTVAALEIVQASLPHLQAVILAPTREIALQITEVITAIGQAVSGLKTCCFIGGYPISLDEKNAKGCQIAVGAPGRMKHLMDKGLLQTQHVRLFVMDEADKLMEKIFLADINTIFSYLPQSKQVLACSATYTEELIKFLSNYMHRGQYVSPQQITNTPVLLGIRQFICVLPHHVDKLAKLRLKERQLLYLLRSVSFNQCLVFSNLHSRAMSVCNLLRGEGWSVEWIAGRQDQADRVIALSQLKEQRVRVLVTTDLTARGIDVENVNLIINLDVPNDHQTYLHRMGRAGRYGSHGMVITILFAEEELARFQELLGVIGGTSQSVYCVPEDLKKVNLWKIKDEDLEQIHGTVKNLEKAEILVEKSGESTDTEEKLSPESSDEVEEPAAGEELLGAIGGTSQSVDFEPDLKKVALWKTKGEDLEQVLGNLKNLENAKSLAEKCEESTDTDEKLSPESSDEIEEPAAKECNGEIISVAETCDCNLYKPESSEIVVVSGPSLFSVSKKEENWREVLPVFVNELKIPLNTPLVLLDSKLVRVKFLDKRDGKSVDIPNTACSRNWVVESETNCDDRDFLSFEDITSAVENGIGLNTDFESNVCENSKVLRLDELGQLSENGIPDAKPNAHEDHKNSLEHGIPDAKPNAHEDHKNSLNKSEQVLKTYQQRREKLETILARFDSFDLVGWMAVDEMHNIVEDLLVERCDVFEFNLLKCPTGGNHIEVLASVEDSLNENNDYEDHITTLNLEMLHLTSPFSLSSIAEKLKCNTSKLSIRPSRAQSKNERIVEDNDKTEEQAKSKISKECKEAERNGLIGKNKKYSSKQNNQKENLDYKITKNERTKTNKKKVFKDRASEVSSNKKFSHVENKTKESKEKYLIGAANGYKKPNPVLAQRSPPETLQKCKVETAFADKTVEKSGTNKHLTKSANNHKEQLVANSVGTMSVPTNAMTQKQKVFSQRNETVMESRSESDRSSLNFSENPCSVPNGHRQSSEKSEDSGPYVDMSQNLAKWQELHDVEESDSVSSSESDAIERAGPLRVRESYSDSTNCSYKTSQAIKHKDFHCRLMKQAKHKKKRLEEHKHKSEESYDSVASEATNRHSFQTACSRHLASEEEFGEYSYSPHSFSRLNYCDKKFFLQASLHSHINKTKTSKNLYKYLQKTHQDQTCHQRRKLADQAPSSHRSPQNSGFDSASQFYGAYDQYNPYPSVDEETQHISNTTQTLRSDNLFSDWYSTWYTEVRQRAKELEMSEYINVMSTP